MLLVKEYKVLKSTDLQYYFVVFGLFILLKFGYTLATVNDMIFLIKPTNTLLECITGSSAVYVENVGYYFRQSDIIIDKSCSGFNFWMLSFLSFSYLFTQYYSKTQQKLASLPFLLVGSYILTILVNTSRIFVSMLVHSQTNTILPNHQQILHQSIGVLTNITFLIITYLLIDACLKYLKNNAKLT